MKLVSAQVKNFRCILDSNVVEIGKTTCLVGKNESGKTAFLKALEGLRSVAPDYIQYDKTKNYPRRYLADYDSRHEGNEAEVLRTIWELEESDKDVLKKEFGEEALTGNRITISKSYEDKTSTWDVPVDHSAVLRQLITRFNLSDADAVPIKGAEDTQSAASQLAAVAEPTKAQSDMLAAINEYRDSDASLMAVDVLDEKTPKFLYFSHYDRMSGKVSVDQLNDDKSQDRIKEDDQIFLDFLKYAGTTLDELTNAAQFEDMNAKCEAAANRITDQIFEYWTQNDQLGIEVRFGEGNPGDEPPFNSGPVARARVRNNIHRVSVDFSERSAGFIWFFSFLVKFAQIPKERGNVIILLDEPGLTLHGTAQKDLLRYFKEELEPNHQLIYSTHSPFMVPADNLASVRTVEDVVHRDQTGRWRSEGTKVRSDVLTTDPQTNFPVFGAMGFEVTQGLIIARDTLLVEGPSDILYLQVFSAKLKSLERTHLNPKWAICPSGGIDKVLPFVRLFYGNDLNTVVLTDFERGQKRKLDALYKSKLLDEERIILATDIAGQEEADVEDFFTPDLFAELLNSAYGLTGEYELTAEKLVSAGDSTQRLVKKAEAYFGLLPDGFPLFGHYEPALYLLRNPDLLDAQTAAVENTLAKFEEAFRRIARYA